MRVGNFSVLIPEGSERESGYVGLDNRCQYTIKLLNHESRRCDAEVTIDGKEVGCFRLDAHGQATLERIPDDPGKLTFYSAGTADAEKAGEFGIATADKGLIQVRFVPEKRRVEKTIRPLGFGPSGQSMLRSASFGTNQTDAEEKTSGGITGLSGHSDQKFVNVGAIDRDDLAAVTISLRLITASNGPRPLKAAVRGNPVPEPV